MDPPSMRRSRARTSSPPHMRLMVGQSISISATPRKADHNPAGRSRLSPSSRTPTLSTGLTLLRGYATTVVGPRAASRSWGWAVLGRFSARFESLVRSLTSKENHSSLFSMHTKSDSTRRAPTCSGCMRAPTDGSKRHIVVSQTGCNCPDAMIQRPMCFGWCMTGCAMGRTDNG
jgi:hypothetical protein